MALLWINFKKLLKSPSVWISLIFLIFFLSFVPASFVSTSPFQSNEELKTQISASIIITGLLIIVLTSFNDSFVKIKNSLIYKNVLLNSKPKYQFYVSTILPIVLFSTIYIAISFSLLVIFDATGVISGSVMNHQKNIINWKNVDGLILVISMISTIILGISIAILISNFTTNINVYSSIIWAYLFLMLFFGGSSVPIFLIRGTDKTAFTYISYVIPNTWTNFLFIDSFSKSIDFKETINLLDLLIPFGLSITFIIANFGIIKFKYKD